MKKIFWFCSILIIFVNTLFVVAFPAYPFVDSILTSFCVLAILFMLYVFFFEEKTSKFLRNTSLVFGIAGLTRIIIQIISLDNFALNVILLGITFSVMLIVFLPAIIGKMVKE